MRVIKRLPLIEFAIKYPDAAKPLNYWYELTNHSHWKTFADVRATFGQTDQARVSSGQTVCIFDIGGNKYRLIAFVSYRKAKVYVLRILTHKEYDSNKWKAEL